MCPKHCIVMYCIFLYCDLHLLGNNIIFYLHINWKLYLFGNEEVEEWPQLISLQAAGQAFAQKVKQTPKLNGLAKKGQTNKKWKCWKEGSNKWICQKGQRNTNLQNLWQYMYFFGHFFVLYIGSTEGVSYILVTDACFEIQFSSKDPNWAEVVAAVDEVKQIFQLKAAKHENWTKLFFFLKRHPLIVDLIWHDDNHDPDFISMQSGYSVSSLVVPKMEEAFSGTGAVKNSKWPDKSW